MTEPATDYLGRPCTIYVPPEACTDPMRCRVHRGAYAPAEDQPNHEGAAMITIDMSDRYAAAMHAMQSGVAAKMAVDGGPESGETSPKHLRVGVNSALMSNGALVELLISKGVITRDEYAAKLIDYAERERELYEHTLSERLGKPVKLS